MVKQDKPKKQQTMNEIMMQDNNKKVTKSGLVTESPIITDLTGKRIETPKDIKKDSVVVSTLQYNESVIKLEPEYTKDEIVLVNGEILVRLFKKIPVYKGVLKQFTVPVQGKKALKPEFVLDPFFFNNLGVVVNYDKTYERDSEWKIKPGSIVQVDPRISMTVVLKLEGVGPYLEKAFFKYDDNRTLDEMGYIQITKRDINCILPKFKLDEYQTIK